MAARQLQMVWPLTRRAPVITPVAGYVLRPFRGGDEAAYLRLMAAAGFNSFNAAQIALWRDRVLPDGWLVAEHKTTGALAATAMAAHRPQPLHPFGGELGWVATHPDHAGKGLGTALCAAVVGRLLTAGYKRIYLQTDDWREPAIHIYWKLGFVPLLASPDALQRWKTVCGKLGLAFSARRCVKPPADWLKAQANQVRKRPAWRAPSEQADRLRIFREELDDFLPRRILDFHVHVMPGGVTPEGEPYHCAGSPLAKYDLKNLQADLDAAYPGRSTAAVCFGFPNVDYDMARNNRYLAGACDRQRFFPLRLFDPHESDHEAVRRDIVEGRFLGLKPYLNYVRKPDPNDVEIREMLPPWIMEIADELGLIVMLHIPRKQRLADPVNQEQVVELCRRYPGARIVLAHIGRAYFLKNIVGQLERFRGLANLWYDLAMLNNWEVLEYLFKNVPADRILYATDTPIALAPGVSVEINHQYSYITPAPWNLSINDAMGKVRYTSFLYEEIRAIRKAVERLGLDKRFVNGLFYDNGMRLLAMSC